MEQRAFDCELATVFIVLIVALFSIHSLLQAVYHYSTPVKRI